MLSFKTNKLENNLGRILFTNRSSNCISWKIYNQVTYKKKPLTCIYFLSFVKKSSEVISKIRILVQKKVYSVTKNEFIYSRTGLQARIKYTDTNIDLER